MKTKKFHFWVKRPSVHAFYLLINKLCPWMDDFNYRVYYDDKGIMTIYVTGICCSDVSSPRNRFRYDCWNASDNTLNQCVFYV